MTDRFHSLVVVLKENTRSDDALRLMDAIGQMRGVVSVSGKVADLDTHMAEERAKQELREKLWEVLK